MWLILVVAIMIITIIIISEQKYKKLETEALEKLGFSNWNVVSYLDERVIVKSRQTLEKYDDIKFFKENKEKLERAERIVTRKYEVFKKLNKFLESNEFESRFQYKRLKKQIEEVGKKAEAYRIDVKYITSAGNNLASKEIALRKRDIDRFKKDPSLLMGKGEYNKYLKEQQKAALDLKHHEYYENVNHIVDYANDNRDSLIVNGSCDEMDRLITQLFDRTVNNIKKIKTIDSEEWDIIGEFIFRIKKDIEQIVSKNQKILEYYESSDFLKIKNTCEVLMSTQREFNEYIKGVSQSLCKPSN